MQFEFYQQQLDKDISFSVTTIPKLSDKLSLKMNLINRKSSKKHQPSVIMDSTVDRRFRGSTTVGMKPKPCSTNQIPQPASISTMAYVPIYMSSLMFFVLFIVVPFCLLWSKYSVLSF